MLDPSVVLSDFSMTVAPYGTLSDGRDAQLFTLVNPSGLTATLTDYGARLVSFTAPDRDGAFVDVTAGFDELSGWENDVMYMGASVGRFGNRIALGKFELDGVAYTLATNNEPNHLHGGNVGFDKKIWAAQEVTSTADRAVGIRFTLVSSDGDEGFPGTLTSVVTYWLNDRNELTIDMTATTDAPTVVNLVNHTYWNLAGNPWAETIEGHELTLNADQYLPIDATSIPLPSAPDPVAGTPFDFLTPFLVGDRIAADDEQIVNGSGYDHCFVVNGSAGTLRPAAKLRDPESGRTMTLFTDQPGVQFYSGSFLGGATGKTGREILSRGALCLETENFPDAPNRSDFPSSVLRPGETYRHVMIHRFTVE